MKIGNHKNVFEYDGAFHCLDCDKKWGAILGEPLDAPENCGENKMSDNKCKNCCYCVGSKDVKNIGTEILNCFYGPPVPYPLPVGPGNISVITIRPVVNPDDWCSHWKSIIKIC